MEDDHAPVGGQPGGEACRVAELKAGHVLGLGPAVEHDADAAPAFQAQGELWLDGQRRDAWPVEARGIGILGADPSGGARIVLAVDLAEGEPDRLPPFREITILGCPIPLVLGRGAHHLSYALFQYLKGGRRA